MTARLCVYRSSLGQRKFHYQLVNKVYVHTGMSSQDRLRVYLRSLRRHTIPVACVDCDSVLLPKHFENHHATKHLFNPKLRCPWCQKQSWKNRTKYLHADHLLQCSRDYIARNRLAPTNGPEPTASPESAPCPSSPRLRLADLVHPFAERVGFEIRHDLPPHALEPINVLEVTDARRRRIEPFRDENLNVAASWVLLFRERRKTHEVFHAMIKSGAYPSFREAMLQEGVSFHTLPFSCWCNGGKDAEAKYRQHFHVLVFAPIGRFRQIWERVGTSDRPRPNFSCKKLRKIPDEMHLINAILYVSNRRSRCEFDFRRNPNAPRKDHHFFLAKTLPRESLLPLCLLFEDGWERFLYQTQFQNASALRILQRPHAFRKGQWKQRLRDFYDLPRGIVLPVRKTLAPTSEPSFPAFHLADGRKLYFEVRPEYEALDEETWLQRQADGGNCFFDVLEDEWWTPRKKIQREIGIAKAFGDGLRTRVEELTTRNEELTARNEELTSRNSRLVTRLVQLESRRRDDSEGPEKKRRRTTA